MALFSGDPPTTPTRHLPTQISAGMGGERPKRQRQHRGKSRRRTCDKLFHEYQRRDPLPFTLFCGGRGVGVGDDCAHAPSERTDVCRIQCPFAVYQRGGKRGGKKGKALEDGAQPCGHDHGLPPCGSFAGSTWSLRCARVRAEGV